MTAKDALAKCIQNAYKLIGAFDCYITQSVYCNDQIAFYMLLLL